MNGKTVLAIIILVSIINNVSPQLLSLGNCNKPKKTYIKRTFITEGLEPASKEKVPHCFQISKRTGAIERTTCDPRTSIFVNKQGSIIYKNRAPMEGLSNLEVYKRKLHNSYLGVGDDYKKIHNQDWKYEDTSPKLPFDDGFNALKW